MNHFSKRASVAFALSLVLLLGMPSPHASAGTTGGLNGTVTDATTKAPLAGAKVSADSPAQAATATTDAGGRYSFVNLAPDTYTLRVEKDGYEPYSATGVSVNADQQLTVDIAQEKA